VLYDIRVYRGSVFRSEQRGADGRTLVLVKDDTAYSLNIGDDETVHLCRLLPSDGEMLVKGYSTSSYKTGYHYWLRGRNGIQQQWVGLFQLADLYLGNTDRSAVFLDGGKVRDIWFGNRYQQLTAGRYALYSKACTDFEDGTLYVALTDVYGKGNLLVSGDRQIPFPFNGCFTGVRVE